MRRSEAPAPTKRGVFEVSQDPIIVPQAAYNSRLQRAPSRPIPVRQTSRTPPRPSHPIGAARRSTIPFEPKAIQDEMGEAYDTEYGRMSGYARARAAWHGSWRAELHPLPLRSLRRSSSSRHDPLTPRSARLGDGTQIWKITHNGVDTHPIHFHLFNVQLINRVAWDDAVRAARRRTSWAGRRPSGSTRWRTPSSPCGRSLPTLPFEVPNSVRLIDPTMPLGEPLHGRPGRIHRPDAAIRSRSSTTWSTTAGSTSATAISSPMKRWT